MYVYILCSIHLLLHTFRGACIPRFFSPYSCGQILWAAQCVSVVCMCWGCVHVLGLCACAANLAHTCIGAVFCVCVCGGVCVCVCVRLCGYMYMYVVRIQAPYRSSVILVCAVILAHTGLKDAHCVLHIEVYSRCFFF